MSRGRLKEGLDPSGEGQAVDTQEGHLQRGLGGELPGMGQFPTRGGGGAASSLHSLNTKQGNSVLTQFWPLGLSRRRTHPTPRCFVLAREGDR